MDNDLRALSEIFLAQQSEFYLEVSNGSEPFACVCGYRMSHRIALSKSQAEVFIRKVKLLARLSDSDPLVSQSGDFELDGRRYIVNCCPQLEGEILVFHRQE